jgi:GTP-binding protein
MVDVMPPDGSDPVKAIHQVEIELEKYSQQLAEKPRWLVFNKIDLLGDTKAEYIKEILVRLDWQGPVYEISGLTKEGTENLVYDIMNYIKALKQEA